MLIILINVSFYDGAIGRSFLDIKGIKREPKIGPFAEEFILAILAISFYCPIYLINVYIKKVWNAIFKILSIFWKLEIIASMNIRYLGSNIGKISELI